MIDTNFIENQERLVDHQKRTTEKLVYNLKKFLFAILIILGVSALIVAANRISGVQTEALNRLTYAQGWTIGAVGGILSIGGLIGCIKIRTFRP